MSSAIFYWRDPANRHEEGNEIESATFEPNGVGVTIEDSDGNPLLRVTIDSGLTVRVNGTMVSNEPYDPSSRGESPLS